MSCKSGVCTRALNLVVLRWHMLFVSFEAAPEDPLLRADIAKRDEARGALKDEAAENGPAERPVERNSAETAVEVEVAKTTVPNEDEAKASREQALAKEVNLSINLPRPTCTLSEEGVKPFLDYQLPAPNLHTF